MKKSRPHNLSIDGLGRGIDVVVVLAGPIVVVVTDVVVEGDALAAFDEQLASAIGSVTATTASGFLKDLIVARFPIQK